MFNMQDNIDPIKKYDKFTAGVFKSAAISTIKMQTILLHRNRNYYKSKGTKQARVAPPTGNRLLWGAHHKTKDNHNAENKSG